MGISNFYIYQYNVNAPKEGKIDVHLYSNSIDSVSNTLSLINELAFSQKNNFNLLKNFNSKQIYNSLFNDINLLSQQKKLLESHLKNLINLLQNLNIKLM